MRSSGLQHGPFVAAVLAVLAACAGTTSTHTPPSIRVGAGEPSPGLRDFDAGLRALGLGGPEANLRAAESFAKAVEADPTLWEAWYDLGAVRWRLGDNRAAAAAFGKAIAIDPTRTSARVARAEALRRMGKIPDARADYDAALERDPEDHATRLRLASLQRESGDFNGSLQTVREVLRHNGLKENRLLADANVELGLGYLAAGRVELADLVLTKAAEADSKNPRVWNSLGLLALKQGNDQEAFQRLDHATDLDPSFRDARFNKATVLLDAGDYAKARIELDRALAGQNDDADLDALVALGVAHRGLGDFAQAKASWERVLNVAPMHADALFDLALLELDGLHNESAARSLFERYLAAAPEDHPRITEARSRLGELGPLPAPPATPAPVPRPKKNQRRPRRRFWLPLAGALFLGATAQAAPRKRPARPATAAPLEQKNTLERAENDERKEKTFDFAAMGIEGKVLAPQLLYLLGRIKVELEKGSLENRSFLPELVRSVDEGGL